MSEMSKRGLKEGDRIIAVKFADKDTVVVYGEGVYLGERVPPAHAVGLGRLMVTGHSRAFFLG